VTINSYYDSIKQGGEVRSSDVDFALKEGFGDKDTNVLGNAAKEALSPFAISRIYDRRRSQFDEAVDKKWDIDDKVKTELEQEYSAKDAKYLSQSRSEPEFLARKRYVAEDIERQRAIAEGGGGGLVATVGFSLLDPISIAAGLLSGGVGYGAKLTGLARVSKIALMSGIENAAIELILAEGNTQSSPYDVLMAMGAGATIGAALSPLTRAKNPKVSGQADEADRVISEEIENFVAFDISQRAGNLEPTPISDIDTRAINSSILDRTESLTRETESFMTSGQLSQLDKRISKATTELDNTDKILKEAQLAETGKRDVAFKKEAEFAEDVEPKIKDIESKFSKRISEAEADIKRIERKPDTTKRAGKLYKAEQELISLKKLRDADIKKVRAAGKKKVTTAKGKFRKSFADRVKDVKAKRESISRNITDMNDIKDKALKAKRASTELNKWNKLSDEEKASQLFGESPPLRQVELDRQIEEARRMSAEPEETTVKEGEVKGSAGAQFTGFKPFDIKSEQAVERFAVDGANMPDDLRGRRFLPNFTKHVQSIQTRLSNSENMAIRGMSYHLFEAPQGGTAADITVSTRVHNNNTIIRSAMRNRLNEGLEEWGTSQGIPLVKTLMDRKNFTNYHKKVMIEVKYPGTFSNEGIVKGAAGVRDQLKEAGRIRKEAGEAGFENLDLDKNYVPIIVDNNLVKTASRQHGDAKVTAVISKGYQDGHFKLKPELADRIAEGYVKRALDNSLTMKDVIRTTSNKDVNSLIKGLEEAGVDKAIIDDFLETTMQKEVKSHLSNRAKKSLYPDIRVEVAGLKMQDLIENDLPRLLESYTRDSSAGAAFAKLGFTTRAQTLDFLSDLERQSNNLGLNQVNIAEEIQVLRDGVDLLYGRSINKEAHSPFVRNLGRLRDLTSFLRLQSVGVASIPEAARVTAQRGLSTVLENVPDLGIGIRGTKHLREGGKYSGLFKRPDLRENEVILGYTGEDHVLYPNGLRVDNLEESGFHKGLGALLDNALAQGKRIQEITSAFRAVQGGGEKIAARSLGSQIKKWVNDTGDSLSEANIKDAGWFEDDFLDDLKVWMKDNPSTDTFNGEDVMLFNFSKMPADMQERLQIGMHRLVRRDMQRPYIGEVPTIMHKWLGQTVTQFRSFSLLSLEKQLVHDIRHDRIAGSMIALQSAFLGYTALSINAMIRGIGREDSDEYIKNQLTGTNAILGTFNRMGQTASLGIGLDFLATLGALPDEMMASPGQTGYRGLTSSSIPLVGMTSDVKDIAVDMVDILKGDGDAGKTLRDIQQVVPFGKTIGIQQAFNALAR